MSRITHHHDNGRDDGREWPQHRKDGSLDLVGVCSLGRLLNMGYTETKPSANGHFEWDILRMI